MSGGIAYVHNPLGEFEKRVNLEMVDLDPMEDEDFELLRRMLRNHFSCTSSKVAREMLENWDIQRQFFTKVMPRDYKAVLAKRTEKVKVDVKVAVAY